MPDHSRHHHHHPGKQPWWKRFRGTAAIAYVIRHATEPRNRLVVERAGVRPGDRVVDIGCGPGEAAVLAAAAAPGVRVIAVDPGWPFRLATALRTLGGGRSVRVRRGTAERLPIPDGWATLVLSINAFHHWEDPRRGLAEVQRVLAPGGRLVLVDEDFPEDHQHTRFHREAGAAAPVDAGSPRVPGWLDALGFHGVRLDRFEDAGGTPYHLLRAERGAC